MITAMYITGLICVVILAISMILSFVSLIKENTKMYKALLIITIIEVALLALLAMEFGISKIILSGSVV